ncbi:hypothetical protein [Nitrosomonas sp. Is79A3]|uniref:hypothetical protein n=1 Tax=Nitrosomonas sp. (strain Is79A3) TaxID=261292 RepID=UPI00030F28E5
MHIHPDSTPEAFSGWQQRLQARNTKIKKVNLCVLTHRNFKNFVVCIIIILWYFLISRTFLSLEISKVMSEKAEHYLSFFQL